MRSTALDALLMKQPWHVDGKTSAAQFVVAPDKALRQLGPIRGLVPQHPIRIRSTLLRWPVSVSRIAMLCVGMLCIGAVWASLAGCRDRAKTRIVIGSKNFTEQIVLAELLAQHIVPACTWSEK
jgi:hypothetical protein